MSDSYFTASTIAFLRDLKANNDRDWFNANKERYEEHVRMPAMKFIADFAPHLASISPHFVADPRPVGGSMFRIYRDVRFSKDKSPYKTHVGLQFRHAAGKDVHAPGFYLGIEPGQSVEALGVWHPDGKALRRIREAIADDPEAWHDAVDAAAEAGLDGWYGESLVRAPKGYEADHPLIEDLKRKDFVVMPNLTEDQVTSGGFIERYAAACRGSRPFIQFLCNAVDLPC